MAATLLASSPRAALAFGGVLVDDSGVRVTAHRMALAVQRDGTVMWDQVTLSSARPARIVWLLPVRPGSIVELTGSAWFDALESTTAPVVYSPPDFGERGVGCAPAGCDRDHVLGEGPKTLAVKRMTSVGPVESAHFSSAEVDALFEWATARGARAPSGAREIALAYAREGWELAALYLEPRCEETTRTVRVTSPRGAPITMLPTRLLSFGATATVDLTIFTLGETRYAPAAYATSTVNFDRLSWDEADKTSNYDLLLQNALSKADRPNFVTELADVPGRAAAGRRADFPVFYELYPALCGQQAVPEDVEVSEPSGGRCRTTASDAGSPSDAGDAGGADGGDGGADGGDGGADAGLDGGDDGGPDAGDADAGDGGAAPRPVPEADRCAATDDIFVGLRTLDPKTVTLTRMRADLSSSTLTRGDLEFVPATGFVSNQLQAVAFKGDGDNEPSRDAACVTTARRRAPEWTTIAVSLVAIGLAWARRRMRR